MSFARVFTRKTLPLTRTRLFTTTPFIQKSATEETIQKVNKATSEPLVKGIEKAGELRLHFPLYLKYLETLSKPTLIFSL